MEKGKIIKFISIFLFFFLPYYLQAGEVRVNLLTEFYYNEIKGPGKENSIYEKYSHYLQEVEIFSQGKMSSVWDYNFNTLLRWTDSRNIDREKSSVESFKFIARSKLDEITVGDYFANFSQYTINRAVKGLGYSHKWDEEGGFFLETFAGYFAPQWEYLYKEVEGEPMERKGGGLRLGWKRESNEVGLNFVGILDDRDDDNRGTEDAYKQNVVSLNWRCLLGGFDLQGEHASSYTRKFVLDGDDDTLKGLSNKLRVYKRFNRNLCWRFQFEKTDPEFMTLGGAYTPDRERFKNKFDWRVSRKWKFYMNYEWYRDNLDNQKETTKVTQVGELGARVKGLFFQRKRQSTTIAYRLREVKARDESEKWYTERIKLGLSDRFGKVNFRGKVEWLFKNDRVGESDSDKVFYSLMVNTRKRVKEELTLKPYFEVSYDDAHYEKGDVDTLTQSYRAGVNFQSGKCWMGGLNLELGEMDTTGGIDSDRKRVHTYLVYLPPRIKDFQIKFDYSYNDYHFSESSSDYIENLFKVSFKKSF